MKVESKSLIAISDYPSDPVSVYLSSLASGGRRSVRSQLNVAVRVFKQAQGGVPGYGDIV